MDQETIIVVIPAIGVIIAAIFSVCLWFLSERTKRIYEEYKRKEDRYAALVKALRGFYVHSLSRDLRNDFLEQLNLCWMYCPDEVIRKGYDFLEMVREGAEASDQQKERAVGEFMLAIRNDLIGRRTFRTTNLRPEDFKHLRPT